VPNTVGFLGAGQLGEPMVERLLGAGRDVVVYARREEVRLRLGAKGAAMADSVADLARRSDILISCLSSDAQLRETGLGARGFITNAKPGAVFVSHTTGTLCSHDQGEAGWARLHGTPQRANAIANRVRRLLPGTVGRAVRALPIPLSLQSPSGSNTSRRQCDRTPSRCPGCRRTA
jgi:NAD binding domain of 6-phosphogluconate dehydrogenase